MIFRLPGAEHLSGKGVETLERPICPDCEKEMNILFGLQEMSFFCNCKDKKLDDKW